MASTRTRRPARYSSIARKPTYVGGMLEMANARLYPFWGSLTEGLRTGEPQNEAKAGARPVRRDLPRPRDPLASSSRR